MLRTATRHSRWIASSSSALLIALLALPSVSHATGSKGLTTTPSPMRNSASVQQVRLRLSGDGDCLRLTAAGVRTRASSSPFARGVITLAPGPAATNIVWAGLYWTILDSQPRPISVTLNGVAVAGATVPLGVTASPCWGIPSAYAYFANVTGIVNGGPNLVDFLDDSGNPVVAPSSEGASLVVVYRSETSGACEIIVTDGNDLFVPPASIDNPLPVSCPANRATLWFVGGDGQAASDNQMWNGAALGDGDDFDNSDPATLPAFEVGWDTDPWGVSTAAGSVASLALPFGGDCINWVATAIEVGVTDGVCGPTPTKRSTWGQIKTTYR